MWRSIIIQFIIYFDPLPYYANANNTLLYKIDLPGNIRALGVGVGGGGGRSGGAFGELQSNQSEEE